MNGPGTVAADSHQDESRDRAIDPVSGHPEAIDPLALALEWLPDNDEPERPQMTLSTVDAEGGPDARTLLLSRADETGFWFHTNAQSRKIQQLAADPRVALTLLWPGFTRQLIIRGVAESATAENIAATFAARSPYLQQLAVHSTTGFAQLPRAQRLEQWAAFADENPAGFEQSESWTGYLVRPTRLTFWTGDVEASSHRTEYELVDGGWSRSYLAG